MDDEGILRGDVAKVNIIYLHWQHKFDQNIATYAQPGWMEITMAFMAERKKNKPLQMRLHDLLRQQLELLVDRNASSLTAEVTIAIRKHLRDEGLWPPPKQEAEGDSGA